MAMPPAARISAMVAARRTVMERVRSVMLAEFQGDLITEPAQVPDHQAGASQLAPQTRDVELDRIDADFLMAEGEQLLEDALLRHDAAAVEHQDLQHAELPPGQLHRRAGDAGRPPGGIKRQLAVFDHPAAFA